MFKVNDYVMTVSSGPCQITDIKKGDSGSDETGYYVLRPVYQNNMTLKIPVPNANVLMRPLLTKAEVLALIETMPAQETLSLNNTREKFHTFKAILKTYNNEELIKVIKTLYQEQQERAAVNKKLPKAEEHIMNIAEKHLYEEFAIALNISPDEVVPYITEHISSLEE